jgi:hypothetical protein
MTEQMFKGFEGTIMLNGDVVGRAESFSIDVSNSVDRYFEIGNRIAAELKEGNFEVSGSISSGFINSAKLELAIGGDGSTMFPKQRLPSFEIVGMVENTKTGRTEKVTLKNVKLDTWSWDLPAEDWVMESVDFLAQNISRNTRTTE